MASATSNRAGTAILALALLVSGGAVVVPGKALAQSSGNGLTNLIDSIFSKSSPPPQAATGSDGAAPPWSGEDGASGHPLMTAAAIRQAAANFPACVAAMWPDAARRNITQENFQRFTTGL